MSSLASTRFASSDWIGASYPHHFTAYVVVTTVALMTRFCEQCGGATDKHGDNLFVCSNGHENWVNPAPGSTIFIVRDGEVLYGVRGREPSKGLLDPPGGFIELNESAEQAAIRETKEEFGIDIELRHLLGTYASLYDGRPVLNIAFVGCIVGGEIAVGDDMSGGDPVWRRIDDLPVDGEHAASWLNQAHDDLRAWLRMVEGA